VATYQSPKSELRDALSILLFTEDGFSSTWFTIDAFLSYLYTNKTVLLIGFLPPMVACDL